MLTFVINGDELPLVACPDDALEVSVGLALAGYLSSRPRLEWELRYESGERIDDTSQPVSRYGFRPGAHLYLTLEVGARG